MKTTLVMFFLLLSSSCSYILNEKKTFRRSISNIELNDQYVNEIKNIFDKRCVTCHGCYTSPCNLKLEAFEGFDRGINKLNPYDFRRIAPMRPNRLFLDAQTTKEWQNKHDFSSIVHRGNDPQKNLDNSILYHILELRHSKKYERQKDKNRFIFNAELSRTCPNTITKTKKYIQRSNPLHGMPYGMAKLSENEYQTLINWIKKGSPGPSKEYTQYISAIPAKYREDVKEWEDFLNNKEIKHRITARYLYEHLYLAALYFGDGHDRVFFRLIRSKTKSPQNPINISTTRPYDDPKTEQFYYRLQRITETIVHKNHITFNIDQKRLDHFKNLFIKTPWPDNSPKFPSWSLKTASVPFMAFKSMPVKSRYRFFIENSEYFIRSFIRGPVCYGQVATNVIRDHFWAVFMDPDSDPEVNQPGWFEKVGNNLAMPAHAGDKGAFLRYERRREKYLKQFRNLYQEKFSEKGLGLNDIWDGDGNNPNAVITIFRHHNSATVRKGLIGGVPKTLIVLNYSLFERIYYDLVAGFDVYGGINHKIATRRYMDKIRMEFEDLFLGFLPKDIRLELRQKWNAQLGALVRIENPIALKELSSKIESEEEFDNANPVSSFAKLLVKKRFNNKVFTGFDKINHNDFKPSPLNEAPKDEDDIDALFSEITSKHGKFASYFREITFVKVEKSDSEAYPYTIINNRDRKYVNYLFFDGMNHSKNKLNVFRGFLGSFPNQFFRIKMSELPQFINELKLLKNREDWDKIRNSYMVKRTDDRFWRLLDWFHQKSYELTPRESGVFDIGRYFEPY